MKTPSAQNENKNILKRKNLPRLPGLEGVARE